MAITFYIPTSNAWVICFFTFPHLQYLKVYYFYLRHSNKHAVISHYSYNLQSLMANNVEHIFTCILQSIYPLWWNKSSCLLPIFKLTYLLLFSFVSSSHVLDPSTLLDICFENSFFQPAACLLILFTWVFENKSFTFWSSPIYLFFSFIDSPSGVKLKNSA